MAAASTDAAPQAASTHSPLDISVVDAHHHLWDLRNPFPWLQDPPGVFAVHGDDLSLRRNYLVSDLQTDAGSVTISHSVVIEAAPADALADARWLQQLADAGTIPSAIVAAAHLEQRDAASHLAAIASLPCVRGVRQILNWHPDPRFTYTDRRDLITDRAWLAAFKRLSQLNLSFDLQVYPWQLDEAATLAHGHGSTQFILNHAGMPIDRSDEGLQLWRAGLRKLAAQANVTVKISGIGMTDHHWTQASLRPIIRDTLEAFGTDRAMFASNFPVDGLYSSYEDLYAAYAAATVDLSPDERRAVFADNARRVYRLPDPLRESDRRFS